MIFCDDDGLVVPGKYPPDVVGTPDFIAPEVIETKTFALYDPKRKLPSRYTDLHALAVLIYMYLLYRHPLRGGKVWDIDDPTKDEGMTMGAKALFIEHPTDSTNRVKPSQLDKSELPQGDPSRLPYTICGPYLKPLFDRAFIDGLLINRRVPDMFEIQPDGSKKPIPAGGFVPLTEGEKILLSSSDGGRLAVVQLVKN